MKAPFVRCLAPFPALRQQVLELAGRFVPANVAQDQARSDEARRLRTGIVIAWFGIVCSTGTAVLYAWLGSPRSGLAIFAITPALLLVAQAVRRGLSLRFIGNAITALTWLVTFFVGAQTGGFGSPAIVWAFFHPITTYVACGMRSALAWCGLSSLQVLLFYLAERSGFPMRQDLSEPAPELLRVTGFIACILTNVGLMSAIEEVRAASQNAIDGATLALERQRVLADMHDGIGAHLTGLIMQVRADCIGRESLLAGLEASLYDLRLIVGNLDEVPQSFELGVADLRARIEPRCAASGIELHWCVEAPATPPPAEATLQVLRALQEMTANALRHARTTRIDVALANLPNEASARAWYEVSVRDHGIGIPAAVPVGRGMKTLAQRAQRLGGDLRVEPCPPGTRVSFRFPCRAS